MNFLEPLAFWFALSLPIVIVFYLLKRKRVVKLISSTLLWQKFLAENQANAPFQKLRKNWLLILQLVILALAVVALSRPFVKGNARESSLRVMVLDASASMQSTDVRPSRFEQARVAALKWVDGLRDGEQMMILLAGASTEVKQSPTSDKAALRRALQSCAPSDAPTRLADALKTAGAFTLEKRGEEEVTAGEIHLFSDGAAPDLDELANRNLPLVYHPVGSAGHNTGITRMDVKANPEDPSERAVFVAVGNFSSTVVHTEIELLFDGRHLETRPLLLGATNTEIAIFTAPQTRHGVFTARLAANDDLLVDNQASVPSVMPQPAKVLVVTRGNRFLEKALKGTPHGQITTTAQLADSAETYDVVVLDDVIPAVWPRANVIGFHLASTNWFPHWDTVKTPAIVDWKNTHPLLRFVSFDNVQIAESLAIKPPAWGVALVDSPQTPLIVAGELNRQRIIWVGFDPLQSTWPLRISFPIFIANAIDWLNPASSSGSQLLVQPGTAFRWSLPQQANRAQLTTPDDETRAFEIEPGGREFVVSDTSRQGVYRLRAGTNELTFCVNLMDSNESNIMPREEIVVGKYARVSATTLKRANMELWRWIAAAGLAVLLFEWWFYHKRTA